MRAGVNDASISDDLKITDVNGAPRGSRRAVLYRLTAPQQIAKWRRSALHKRAGHSRRQADCQPSTGCFERESLFPSLAARRDTAELKRGGDLMTIVPSISIETGLFIESSEL